MSQFQVKTPDPLKTQQPSNTTEIKQQLKAILGKVEKRHVARFAIYALLAYLGVDDIDFFDGEI